MKNKCCDCPHFYSKIVSKYGICKKHEITVKQNKSICVARNLEINFKKIV